MLPKTRTGPILSPIRNTIPATMKRQVTMKNLARKYYGGKNHIADLTGWKKTRKLVASAMLALFLLLLPESGGCPSILAENGNINSGSPENADLSDLNEIQQAAVRSGAQIAPGRNTWLSCEDGVFRYFDGNGLMVRNVITPDGVYVDQNGNPQDPEDNNLNEAYLRYASLGRRALGVDKSSHIMQLWENGVKIKTYMVTSGAVPGDKEVSGDAKTPVGYFYICRKQDVDSLLKGELGLNYPNLEDARRGLKNGIIGRDTYESLIRANRSLQKPVWNSPLGGAIEVHGNGQPQDATRGCVGVNDLEIYEVYEKMQIGDRVLICG